MAQIPPDALTRLTAHGFAPAVAAAQVATLRAHSQECPTNLHQLPPDQQVRRLAQVFGPHYAVAALHIFGEAVPHAA